MTSGVRKSDLWNNSGRPNQYRPNLADPAQGATTILGATGPVEAKNGLGRVTRSRFFFSSKPDTLLSTFRLPFAIFTKFGKDTRNFQKYIPAVQFGGHVPSNCTGYICENFPFRDNLPPSQKTVQCVKQVLYTLTSLQPRGGIAKRYVQSVL